MDIKPNTYPISQDSETIVNFVKKSFILQGSSHLDHIDIDTIKELNKLCHPNILLYNVVRNEYILKRFVTVLTYNFGYNHGTDFENNIGIPENANLLEFVKDIFKVANITFVDESTKQTFLRIKFVERGFKPQIIDHVVRANFEFDVIKTIHIVDDTFAHNTQINGNTNLYDWLHGKTLLDIGCGPGHFLGELANNNVSNYLNLNAIDVTMYVKPQYQNKLIFHQYLNSMQFPPSLTHLDFISFFMSIHHIELYKLHLIMLQLYSILNDNGYIFVKEHLVECQEDVTFFKFMETYFYFVEGYIPNVPVEDNYYTRKGMIALFDLYGFKVVTNFKINKYQPFKPFYYLFKKNLSYKPDLISHEIKMSMLTTLVAQMRAENVFSNGNLFEKADLNDFSPRTKITRDTILNTELERTQLQMIRGKDQHL